MSPDGVPDPAVAPDPNADVRRIAPAYLAAEDPTGWFDALYRASADGAVVPWDRGVPHPLLAEWVARTVPAAAGTAVVVGCGFGADAALLAGRGLATTAFDVSPTAVRLAAERFPDAAVRWREADLLDLPADLVGAFDVVVEVMTVQSMPPRWHPPGIAAVASLVAPGGRLLVVGGVGGAGTAAVAPAGPPWPLDEAEVRSFAQQGLTVDRLERLTDPSPRWRATFSR